MKHILETSVKYIDDNNLEAYASKLDMKYADSSNNTCKDLHTNIQFAKMAIYLDECMPQAVLKMLTIINNK